MRLKPIGLMLAMLSLEACLVVSSTGGNPTPHPASPSPTWTATLQATPSPAVSQTPTILTEEDRSSLLQTHQVMVMIQFDAEATAGTAGQIVAGSISPSDLSQSVLAISGLADGTEWVIPFIMPPARLQSLWEAALAAHAHTRELLASWANGSMDAAQVEQEIQSDLTSISQTVGEVERILVNEYGFDMQSLIEAREEALAGMRGTLEATASPR